jgi:hypothetical protein
MGACDLGEISQSLPFLGKAQPRGVGDKVSRFKSTEGATSSTSTRAQIAEEFVAAPAVQIQLFHEATTTNK